MNIRPALLLFALIATAPTIAIAGTSCSPGGPGPLGAVSAPPPAPSAPLVRAPNTPAHLPLALATMSRLGALSVTREFATPVKSVTGYLVNQRGHYSIVYGVGGYVLAGALISPTGSNLTAIFNEQYAPKPDYAAIIKSLRHNGHLITLGNPHAKHVFYTFEDPNCIFCHKLSLALDPYIKAGKVAVNIALVALVHRDALGKATAILSAPIPQAAWDANEAVTAYSTRTEEGGYRVQNPPNPHLVAVIHKTMRIMQKAGFNGTPGVLYHGPHGKWVAINGFPGNAWLTAHLGAP